MSTNASNTPMWLAANNIGFPRSARGSVPVTESLPLNATSPLSSVVRTCQSRGVESGPSRRVGSVPSGVSATMAEQHGTTG